MKKKEKHKEKDQIQVFFCVVSADKGSESTLGRICETG